MDSTSLPFQEDLNYDAHLESPIEDPRIKSRALLWLKLFLLIFSTQPGIRFKVSCPLCQLQFQWFVSSVNRIS